MATALALMPEALYAWVHRGDNAAAAPSPSGASAAASASASEPPPAPLDLRVGGMGCTACTAKVKGALEAMPEVASATVDLQTGSASLQLVGASADDSEFRRRMTTTLKDAGFEARSVDAPTAP